MTDRRRSRWIAFDAMFFGNDLADTIANQFGAAGICVWLAFLCACKRNLVPGQISYTSDADCLAQLGLVWLPLVDNDGKEWELDALWTLLGRVKHVSRRRRGRVTDACCTRWEEWQHDLDREKRAARKSRSRGQNAGTVGGRSGDERGPIPDPDRDKTETETRQSSSTSTETDDPNHTGPVDDDDRIAAAARILGRHDHERARTDGVSIGDHNGFRAACVQRRATDPALLELAKAQPHSTAVDLADQLLRWPVKAGALDATVAAQTQRMRRPDCDKCDTTGVVLDDQDQATACPDCNRSAGW